MRSVSRAYLLRVTFLQAIFACEVLLGCGKEPASARTNPRPSPDTLVASPPTAQDSGAVITAEARLNELRAQATRAAPGLFTVQAEVRQGPFRVSLPAMAADGCLRLVTEPEAEPTTKPKTMSVTLEALPQEAPHPPGAEPPHQGDPSATVAPPAALLCLRRGEGAVLVAQNTGAFPYVLLSTVRAN